MKLPVHLLALSALLLCGACQTSEPIEVIDDAAHDLATSDEDDSPVDESAAAEPADTADPGGEVDAGAEDDSSDVSEPSDDTVTDAVPLAGFGNISGTCGSVDAQVRAQPEPLLIHNEIDFEDDAYDETDYGELSEGGQEILDDGNAGGSSLYSELFAFEVLTRCEAAVLVKTETEILYDDPQGKMTDLLITLGGERFGVSVTRAVGFPRDDPYTVERAQALLEQKLSGIIASSANVSDVDGWNKQILHVIAYEPEHAESLGEAFSLIESSILANTIVYVTVSSGDDEFLY